MRYFNTHGPVNEAEHYTVRRSKLLSDVEKQVARGSYFTIFAPRQMGKTTLLRSLRDLLKERPGFIPITMSFQRFETWPVETFLGEFGRLLLRRIVMALEETFPNETAAIQALVAAPPPDTYARFWSFFDDLQQLIPEARVVLIVDEFDGTPQGAISPLLQMWRDMNLDAEPPRSLHSVVLVGIQNIATLNLGRSSPFNIANQLALPNFTPTQIGDLLGQHTKETGQKFAPDVLDEIVRLTAGYPFLVNRLAAILTEQVVTDRDQLIERVDLDKARQALITETNYNFETIIRHANEHREVVLNILFGANREYNLNDSVVSELQMQGIVSGEPRGNCRIANPIYADVLLAALRPAKLSLQTEILA